MRPDDRPGLLLMCHGDLPDAAIADPQCRRLYAGCAELYELMVPEIIAMQGSSIFSGLNEGIASYLSSESDGPVEQASLGFHRPGVRDAMFRLTARGSRSIVCLGGAGLVLPGQGASVYLPEAVRRVVAENAGLDVCCARPGFNPYVMTAMVMASIECALKGRGVLPGPSWEAPRIGSDTGVLVVSAPDPSRAMAACARESAGYITAVKQLSDRVKEKSTENPTTEIARFMSSVAEGLDASGAFCAVRPGYLDFAVPDLEAAADELAKAGAQQILVAGMPVLLSRHPLSWADPSDAIDHLKKKCPAQLIYVKPDPQSCAKEIAAMLRMNVLEAASFARQQGKVSPFS
jgi:hypothetical protein